MSDDYFLELQVENLRCFGPRQTLDLRDRDGNPAMWNVLIGENGTGKTTLLQVLAMMRTQAVNHPVDDSIVHLCEFVIKRLIHPRNPEAPSNVECKTSAEHIQALGAFGTILDKPKLTHLHAYGASRRMSATSVVEDEAQDPTATLFDDEAQLINAEEWYLRQHLAALEPGDHQEAAARRRDRVKELLTSVLFPDVEDVRVAGLAEQPPRPRLEVETHYGWVRLRDLSLGYRALLAWMVDFVSRMFTRHPDSEDPMAEPAVVLVDEIDLHLHPSWQRELVGFLRARFPRTQFIVTAHSPLVVQAAEDANVILLRREGDHVVIDDSFDAVSQWRVDQILMSDLFGLASVRPPALDEVMTRRRELLRKDELTDADREELRELDAKLDDSTGSESPEEREAMRLVMEVARHMKERGLTGEGS